MHAHAHIVLGFLIEAAINVQKQLHAVCIASDSCPCHYHQLLHIFWACLRIRIWRHYVFKEWFDIVGDSNRIDANRYPRFNMIISYIGGRELINFKPNIYMHFHSYIGNTNFNHDQNFLIMILKRNNAHAWPNWPRAPKEVAYNRHDLS